MSRRPHLARTAAAMVVAAAACTTVQAAKNIVLIYNGDAIPNTQAGPNTAAFNTWCGGTCTPSVDLPVFDPSSGKPRGNILVWTMPFVSSTDGLSFCFSEFIVYRFTEGEVHTASHPNGVCGATISPLLKEPTHAQAPAVVVAGGGDGVVVDGTGAYLGAKGTYTDRVFVELSFSGGANYYDQLIFKLTLEK